MSDVRWTGGVPEYVSGISRGLLELGHEVVSSWLAIGRKRTPLVGSLYLHPADVGSGRRRRLQLSALIRRLDLLIGVSAAEVRLTQSVASPRRAGVVWPGMAELPDVQDRTGLRPLVLSVGRLSTDKGAEVMLRAMALLPGEIDIAIVAGGPDWLRWERFAAELGIDTDIALRGGSMSDEEIAAVMDRATVYFSASSQESFGIALMKSIAHGCRPLVSDIPSHREIVRTLGYGESKLFTLDIDANELARRLVEAATSGDADIRRECSVPTWARSASELVDLYELVVRSARG